MKENRMKLNVTKTQFISLGNCHHIRKLGQLKIEIDGNAILSQETLKSLGLTIDSRLSWSEHINRLSRSYHLSAHSMYPLRSLLTDQQFLQIFSACVASKCNYITLLWGNANRKNCKVIERKIRQPARIILRKSWQDPISSDIIHQQRQNQRREDIRSCTTQEESRNTETQSNCQVLIQKSKTHSQRGGARHHTNLRQGKQRYN
jgi:hypothetical protein